MKRSGLSAVAAERLFAIAIVALIGIIIVDFIFITNILRARAREADHTKIQADISDEDITKVRSAQEWLDDHQDEVNRAQLIVADSSRYQYQNQIIKDFQDFAAKVGISISGFTFSNPTTGGTQPSSSSTTTPSGGASASSAPASSGNSGASTPKGVSSINVAITLGEKISYQQYLNLLRLIEQNVTRMQVTDVSLTPDGQDPNTITSPTLNVIVYIKELRA